MLCTAMLIWHHSLNSEELIVEKTTLSSGVGILSWGHTLSSESLENSDFPTSNYKAWTLFFFTSQKLIKIVIPAWYESTITVYLKGKKALQEVENVPSWRHFMNGGLQISGSNNCSDDMQRIWRHFRENTGHTNY